MARTAITLGITKNGEAEIIHQPSVSLHHQRRELNELAGKKGNSKYSEIQLWESGRGLRRKVRVGKAAVNENIDYNSAHSVDHQKNKKNADLTPTAGNSGGVDFNASHLVEHQQDKVKSKKLPDLNSKFRHAETSKKGSAKKQGVNFDAARHVDEPKNEKPGIDRARTTPRHRDSRSHISKKTSSRKQRISDAASSKTSTELAPPVTPAKDEVDDAPAM